jgi:hypothetical protein
MAVQPLPIAQERRRHQRVKISVLGRYMLENRREYPCQAVNMSPGGIALIAPVVGNPGERVVAYLDHIGRVEGQIVRHLQNGFAMTIAATVRKREKLAAQLTWLANRHALNLPEDRRHERILPKNPRTTLTLSNGTVHPCRVIDMSLSGAGVATEARLEIGSVVMLGRMQSRVVRHFEGGIALEFRHQQLPSVLEAEFGGL